MLQYIFTDKLKVPMSNALSKTIIQNYEHEYTE